MVECKARGSSFFPSFLFHYPLTLLSPSGLKLLIALSDRYALGFWSTDSYALKLNIVKAGTSGVQKVADASSYYTSASAAQWTDNRLKHIMTHKNAALGKTWAELDEVIYAVEAQNEPQGVRRFFFLSSLSLTSILNLSLLFYLLSTQHMALASSTWACDRSSYLKSLLPSSSSIQVSSGGGITTTASLGSWATGCDAIDIISVHDYGTSASGTAAALAAAQKQHPEKVVMMGAFSLLCPLSYCH
jgi:hypothetical protein